MSTPRPCEADVEAREALWSKPCPFCPIVEGDAPANIVERGDRHIAFVPLGPHVPGHVLFVPTEHLPDATVNPARTGAIVAEAARYVAENRIDANIVTSVGVAATQSVPHLHVHVVPRGPADGLDARWPWLAARDEAAERALADLRGEVKALLAAADWRAETSLSRTFTGDTFGAWVAADDLRALLPRDDAAGAGGAE